MGGFTATRLLDGAPRTWFAHIHTQVEYLFCEPSRGHVCRGSCFPIALKLESESAILSMVMMTVRRVVLEQAQEDLRGDKKNSERWACKSRRKKSRCV